MKTMIPILCEWELPAREGTCPANHDGIPRGWYNKARQPSPLPLERYPRPVFLQGSEFKSQQRWLPPYPDGRVAAPSDTILTHEIDARELDPDEIELLRFCLFLVMYVRHNPTDVAARYSTIKRLHDDKKLAANVAGKVLGGVPLKAVLQPKQLLRLFGASLSAKTIQRDLRKIRAPSTASSTTTSNADNQRDFEDSQAGVSSAQRRNTEESIAPEDSAKPEPGDQKINRACAPEHKYLDETGTAETSANEPKESDDDIARTTTEETSAYSQTDTPNQAAPSHPQSARQGPSESAAGWREGSQERARSEGKASLEDAVIQEEILPESESDLGAQSEIDMQPQSIVSKPEPSAPSSEFESKKPSPRQEASPSEGPISSRADRPAESKQPTEDSVAPVIAQIRQTVPELPPAKELFAIIRQHESGEEKVRVLVQGLHDKRESVQDPSRCLEIGKSILRRLEELATESKAPGPEAPR